VKVQAAVNLLINIAMNTPRIKPIAVLGAGAWGTALALHLAHRGVTVRLWSMVAAEIDALQKERENKRFLPGFTFPDHIHAIADLAEVIADVENVIIAIPSVAFRQTLIALRELQAPHLRIISATKGLEATSGRLLHEIIKEELGTQTIVAVLSGPSFAKEVASHLPTSLMLASHHQAFIHDMQNIFTTKNLRIFPTKDVIGVEVGAIIKNIVAIAVGIADGMQLGANARSAIITQGLHDMITLGNTLGAQIETLVGLAGAGDLILTCTDDQSRNRRFGLALGSGKAAEAAEREMGHVVEGKSNLELALHLAKKQDVKLIIADAMSRLLKGECDAKTALELILDGHA